MKFKTHKLSAAILQPSKYGNIDIWEYIQNVNVTRVSRTTRSIIELHQFIFRLYIFIFYRYFVQHIFCIEHSQDKLNDSLTVDCIQQHLSFLLSYIASERFCKFLCINVFHELVVHLSTQRIQNSSSSMVWLSLHWVILA